MCPSLFYELWMGENISDASEVWGTLDAWHVTSSVRSIPRYDTWQRKTEGAFHDKLRQAGTIIAPIEDYTPNQNRAESSIRELKRMYRRAMISSKAPEVLWDHCFQLTAEICSRTLLQMLRLDWEAPLTRLTGDTVDISRLCQFEWYQYIWWLDVMCQKVLTSKATVWVHCLVFPLSIEDENSKIVKGRKSSLKKN